MARNGSGTYAKINTFSSGATITASGHNQNWDDLVTEMTNSVAADGQTTITGALKGAVGSATTPSYGFSSDTNTGVYHHGADELGFATGGTAAAYFDSAQKLWTLGAADIAGAFNVQGAASVTGATTVAALTASGLVTMSSTSHFLPATGTTAQRPGTPAEGQVRFNTSTHKLEYYNASAWIAPIELPRGHIDGCTLSNGTDTVNDINIAAGTCRDSTNTVDIAVAAMTGKQLDVGWAAGGSAGMRNSAAAIANGTYHIYAVSTASGTQDIYAYAGVAGTDPDSSASIAAVIAALQLETGGSSYIYARRLGSILRESASIVAFTQRHDLFERTTLNQDLSATGASLGTAAVTQTISVPLGLVCEAVVYLGSSSGGSATNILLTPLTATDATPTATIADISNPAGVAGMTGGKIPVYTNSSAQVRIRATGGAADVVVVINTRGWKDARGRDA